MGSSPSLQDGKVYGRWQLVLTGDGSPSFCLASGERNELMHHRGGAFAETQYIYGIPVQKSFAELDRPQILSLGLGLGYNEILVACESLRTGKSFLLQSFELDEQLLEQFLGFVQDPHQLQEVHEVFHEICRLYQVSSHEISSTLLRAKQEGRWVLERALLEPGQIHKGANLFLWDAFSQKTSPQLWEPTFLQLAFQRAAPEAWVSTFACNAALKGALRSENFQTVLRPGYQGKRECTWGLKGRFTIYEP